MAPALPERPRLSLSLDLKMEEIRKQLLNKIARVAYDVGYGVDKHFATHKVYCAVPVLMSILSLSVGIYQISRLSAAHSQVYMDLLSFLMIIFSVFAFYISIIGGNKALYVSTGKNLLELYYRLDTLYDEVNSGKNTDYDNVYAEVDSIRSKLNSISISEHPLIISDWLAHFHFFGSRNITWIDKELDFKFWDDKVPSSLKTFILVLLTFLALIYLGVAFIFPLLGTRV
jgi:hypothetical protein